MRTPPRLESDATPIRVDAAKDIGTALAEM